MGENTIAELKAQFIRMQGEIEATDDMLSDMADSTVITTIFPDHCAPMIVVNPGGDPPRPDQDCGIEIKMTHIEGQVTVGHLAVAIGLLRTMTQKMIQVLDDVDSALPLP